MKTIMFISLLDLQKSPLKNRSIKLSIKLKRLLNSVCSCTTLSIPSNIVVALTAFIVFEVFE